MPHESCWFCPKRIPSSEKKRRHDGGGYICKSCHWKVVNGKEFQLFHAPLRPSTNSEPEVQVENQYESVSSIDIDQYDSHFEQSFNMSLDQVSSVDLNEYCSVVPENDVAPYDSLESDVSMYELLDQSNSQDMTQSSISTQRLGLVELDFFSCNSTERCCFICRSEKGRSRIPKTAMIDLWHSTKIFVPDSNRCCKKHLNEQNVFAMESKLQINADKLTTKLTPSEITHFIMQLTDAYNQKPTGLSFEKESLLSSDDFELLTGLTKTQFQATLLHCTKIKKSSNRTPAAALGIFLMKLRLNLSQEVLGFFFGISQTCVSDVISSVSKVLEEEFVPKYLGYGHISREEFIKNHNCKFAQKLLGTSASAVNAAADATYLYIQRPGDFELQKRTYSAHKHRHLLKPMIICGTDGYILEMEGLYFADSKNNDAQIMNSIAHNESGFASFFRENDDLIFDRGFRDSLNMAKQKKFNVFMPKLLSRSEKQFSTLDANESRRVTMVRFIIESVNGRFKNKFRFFANIIPNSYIPKLRSLLRITLALINCHCPPLFTETAEHLLLAERALARMNTPNLLQQIILEENLQKKRTIWSRTTADNPSEFPVLSMQDLKLITLGSYQTKLAPQYSYQHQNGPSYEFYHHKEEEGLIKAKIGSRFQSKKSHNVWIQFQSEKTGAESISQWYCSCKSGARVAGCCCHVASVLWYLGFARHQAVVPLPKNVLIKSILDASFRDDQMIMSSDESEDDMDYE